MNDNLVTDNLGDIRLYNGDCMEWMNIVTEYLEHDKWI